MNPREMALIRSWIQGVSWDVMGELYLEDADRNDVIRAVKQLREKLSRKAKQLGLDADAKLWEQEREYSQDWMSRALKSVESLKSKPDPKPRLDDHYNRWLPHRISARLASVKKIKTLAELAVFINQHGGSWWKKVPNLGKQSAEVIHDFFSASAIDLGISLDLSPSKAAYLDVVVVSNRIAPLERFAPPAHLTGETGTNRVPVERCRIEARNDYESIMAWLSLWGDDTSTHRAYRKEAERFLLWAILEKGKALSSITTPDCAEYRRFLADPHPADRWVGKPAPRWSPEWRPLKGPLKPSSIRQSEVILSGLCEWLVGQRYLDSNPFTGLSTQGYGRRTNSTDRVLSPALWGQINVFAENQAKNSTLTEAQRNDYRRTAFILKFAYQTGLRLHEIVKARVGDLKQVSNFDGDQWWLDVTGKGNKHREIPVPPSLMDGINAHLRDRKLGPVGYVSEDTPILGKLRGEGREALSASGLYQKLKRFFEDAASEVADKDPLAAEKLKRASTHWLRHTHGSHAVANGVPLAIVRDNLGHSNIATTSIYVHTDRDERYKAMLGLSDKEKAS
ncbi:MAG: tyrosine-type recombinase/integrase [Methylicorpusculum sp.]|uniref:tyrosine-type recombinase/integrase n=1 Tax=Methylicorpusculum sp. TaxID=2713644 RepID=UPI001357D3EA|nr:tyrosine-type recombinase/integrase [Methylicorpusculum sp.]MDP2202785.1 tyrosine-type recombinase/integrase [Methylicorpusculum sp.]